MNPLPILAIEPIETTSVTDVFLADELEGGTNKTKLTIGSKIIDIIDITPDDFLMKDLDNSATVINENITDDMPAVDFKKGWLSFSLSLFPNARLFTQEEQEKIKKHKRKKFNEFEFDF